MFRHLPFALSVLLLSACDPDVSELQQEVTSVGATSPVDDVPSEVVVTAAVQADHGAEVFAQHCASCHGDSARGDGPLAAALDPAPVDLTGPRPAHMRGTPGGRRAVIENGSPGTAMVAFKDVLSPEDLEAVYGFVHALHHGSPPDATDAGCAEHGEGGCSCGEGGGMGPGGGGMGHGGGRGMGPGGGGGHGGGMGPGGGHGGH